MPVMSHRATRITRSGRKLNDAYFKQAKSEGYVARSAYKLLEIQQKHRVIPMGGYVLDLGCHPGAWLQVACQSLGPEKRGGLVLGVDIQATNAPGKYCDSRVKILQSDAREIQEEVWQSYAPRGFDVVLSDMCHFTHGNALTDAFKSLELARTAFEISCSPGIGYEAGILKPGGHLVMKLLQGQGTQEFAQELKQHFNVVKHHRPKATRSESKEIFIVGMNKKSGSSHT